MKTISASLPLISALTAAGDGVAPSFDRYKAVANASAAIALDDRHFVVFDDEKNALHIYRFGEPDVVDEIRFKDRLGDNDGEEFDFEAAAKVGETIFAVTSHGRKSAGKHDTPARQMIGYHRPARHRFFGFTVKAKKKDFKLDTFLGYRTTLIADIHASQAYRTYDLEAAANFAVESQYGLSIEGLAAWKDASVLIGLRAPVVDGGRALLIPLLNPQAYVDDGQDGRFGDPLTLDLGGRGIRDIVKLDGSYAIIAGPAHGKATFALYTWSGKRGDPAREVVAFAYDPALEIQPEVVFSIPGSKDIYVLSDDGDYSGSRHDRSDAGKAHFRGWRLKLEKP